jgi:diguanylate cyclase (GGDEF)-like protein
MFAVAGKFLKGLFLTGPSDAMAEANRPIVQGYSVLAAIYYLCMAPVHFFALSGQNQIIMVLASLGATVVAAMGWKRSRQKVSGGTLEAIGAAVNFAVYANVMLALHTNYDSNNLVYFPMMALGFAFTSVSIRMAIVSISLVLGSLVYELATHFPGENIAYEYIGFATAITGLALVIFLRHAITTAIDAKNHAEGKLVEAGKLNEQMRKRAMSDSLTGLPNRRAFFNILKQPATPQPGGQQTWLVALDLDGFKMVNDVYGHLVGDELLKAVTRRMTRYGGDAAMISRIGGDEFNIILNGVADEKECEAWCNALLEDIARPYDVEGRLIQLSASVGCTKLREGEDNTVTIRNADYALIHAKKNGKNRTVVFTQDHEKNARERFEIEDALRVADFSKEVEVLFQPQVNLAQEQVISAEVLVRWDSPNLGRIEPDRFISIAEECGLISKVTLAVLDRAIKALQSWDDPIPLSINLSGHDLLSNQVVDEIVEMLQASGLPSSLIEFEVTETAMMADTQKACDNLNRLSELGYSVALDDFGTGYSNFNYLRELPIDKLKVDRSFVKDIGNPMTEKILHSLTVTANALGVDCLIEGVEDEIQLVMAKRVGVGMAQGYMFGKPMTSEQLLDLTGCDASEDQRKAG